MQRRRSFVQSKTGMKEDFSSPEEPAEAAAAAPAPAAAPEPEYVGELERLAQLRIRASSPTRTSKPRRSSSSVSERRVRSRREHLSRGHAFRPSFMPLFTGVSGRSFLGSTSAHSCIASVQRPSNLKSPLEETPYWVKLIL